LLSLTKLEIYWATVAVEDHKVLKIAGEQHWRPVMNKGGVVYCRSLQSVRDTHNAQGMEKFQGTV